jgi:fatty acid desaturase
VSSLASGAVASVNSLVSDTACLARGRTMDRIPNFAEQTLPQAENLLKALLFPALLFASFLITRPLTEHFVGVTMPLWVYGVLLLLTLFNGVIVIAIGILTHEAVHRVLFRRPMQPGVA